MRVCVCVCLRVWVWVWVLWVRVMGMGAFDLLSGGDCPSRQAILSSAPEMISGPIVGYLETLPEVLMACSTSETQAIVSLIFVNFVPVWHMGWNTRWRCAALGVHVLAQLAVSAPIA